MKKTLFAFLISTLLFAISCKKDEEVSPEVKFNVALNGSVEVPANTSTATGSFVGTYNKTTKVISYTISYNGVTPTAWHIHKGAVGVSGAVIFGLGTTFNTAYSSTTAALTTDQETDLMAGNYYVNIHSASKPGGEIRGQLILK
ncbi:CHRD domain-containing protein [Arcicella aquatica]|uniref:CHRD domain-containing protein n=1 Tax=Arcicella aquatica TaxID=217141 RepID=A0ABU5QJK8_9BACT|nr:CHRD domain-containing protein [Arcicella aquatica]MEA5257248.1 CHRD domain-containing protein [Arcicella aquatica]